MTELLRIAFLVTIGLALGWFGRGWWDGSDVSASDAATDAQDAVTVAVGETVRIVDASRQTADAAERVRYITRTVEVAPDCPPGRGAVSADLADELREAIK